MFFHVWEALANNPLSPDLQILSPFLYVIDISAFTGLDPVTDTNKEIKVTDINFRRDSRNFRWSCLCFTLDHCLLSCHWVPLKAAWLHIFYSLWVSMHPDEIPHGSYYVVYSVICSTLFSCMFTFISSNIVHVSIL